MSIEVKGESATFPDPDKLMCGPKLEFAGAHGCTRQFIASNDLLEEAQVGNWHYIDEHLWIQLKDEDPKLGEIVKPNPPVSHVVAAKIGQPGLHVVGESNLKPLYVKFIL